ncbi:Serine/threonine-protein kinase atr [Grifola frondosa]|uniref:non-specific serine/threonine protein kinase n=1 Tax=Grifola frondosa TaxID=5627 RepID=A0A1C7M243_GRIFR|nr:Serine/threonine-protein kinase atr [Grifola frondosa]
MIATFQQTGDTSPADFLHRLEELLAGLNKGEPCMDPLLEKASWVGVISVLTHDFLTSFPTPEELSWNMMHEKLKLTEIILELISCVASHNQSLFIGSDDIGCATLNKLMSLCFVLDLWIDTPVPTEENYPSPDKLYDRSLKTTAIVMRSLGSNALAIEAFPHSWDSLKCILGKCVALSNGLLSLPPSTEFPLRVDFWNAPHLKHEIEESIEQLSVKISDLSQVPIFLTTILALCVNATIPSPSTHWYLCETIRNIGELLRTTLDYLFSPSCMTTAERRTRALVRSCTSLISASSANPSFEGIAESMWTRVINYRLHLGPNHAWQKFDVTLTEALHGNMITPQNNADVMSIVTVLRSESWDESGNDLRRLAQSYLLLFVPHLDGKPLEVIHEALNTETKADIYALLLDTINSRLKSLHPSGTDDAQRILDSSTSEWHNLVRASVQAIVEPYELAWMDDGDSLSDLQYIARAFDEIETRFDRPIYNPAPTARQSLARSLVKLLCLLVHPKESECSSSLNKPGISSIPVFLKVATYLLDGSEGEVTAIVRKEVYDMLTRAIRHHTLGFGGGRLEHIASMASRGMKDPERTVRLSAGRSLVELIRVNQGLGSGAAKRTEPLLSIFYKIFETAEDRFRETALVTVGQIGKIATAEVLGQGVCCLVSQLGQQNPVLRGTAYMQVSYDSYFEIKFLVALAKYHKKTPYSLVSPFMDHIAPYLVARLCTQAYLLSEFCRFISVSPGDFLSVTLNRTLPQLFASCDLKVLEAISAEIGQTPAYLLIDQTHHILAYVFRLPNVGQINKVLAFILNILRSATRDDTIDTATLVRSCLVPLLGELVIVLGDENDDIVQTTRAAESRKPDGCAASPWYFRASQDTGDILTVNMLGVISNLNDMLQDVQGKRSIESKRRILRSLGPFIAHIGPSIYNVAPQLMATLQTMLVVPHLADVTLQSWLTFLTTLEPRDLGSHVGPSSASFLASWSSFSHYGREIAKRCLDYMISDKGQELGTYLDEVVDLRSVPQLAETQKRLSTLRRQWTPRHKLMKILDRLGSDSITVAIQSANELKSFMLENNEEFVRTLASGDVFDPLIGHIMSALFSAACRDGEGSESLRVLAFHCIGVLGALDPDRFEIGISDTKMVILSNFTDENESMSFALHLIRDVLVGAFRSTSDIKYQSHLAYTIQQLLRFCKFTPALVNPGSAGSVPLKVRSRWNSLPKHVLETVTPLLASRYELEIRPMREFQHPIYPTQATYRQWVQSWSGYLITKASGERAITIFSVFSSVVRNKDVGVALHLLPHLVLNILVSGSEDDAFGIRSELLAVLEDQVDPDSQSSADKKLLSAQTVFSLMDHLNKWVRAIRQEINRRKADSRRPRVNEISSNAEEQLLRIDSILSSIDQRLMAKAALQCKAYARSLMNFEQQILEKQQQQASNGQLQDYFERLHEIYAHLDEPDGMEGVSTLILSPSLEHQIRQHESTGRWTSAQSCWEVRLQHSPDNLDFHLGLLRCLRNLGHYDTLRTHVKGVLTRNPSWESQLVGFQVESEWMVGNWEEVRCLVQNTTAGTPSILLAQVLLAMRDGDTSSIAATLSDARTMLGVPITAAGAKGYRRSYDAVLDLHLVHELEVIYDAVAKLPSDRSVHKREISDLIQRLSARLDSTLPNFRTREPILSMRRTAFSLCTPDNRQVKDAIGQSWLISAKIARKAGHSQTAYSAVLQAQRCETPSSFMEFARLTKVRGEPLRALQELESAISCSTMVEDNSGIIDLTSDVDDRKMKAKAQLLRARWMNDSDRFEVGPILKAFQVAAELYPKWESSQFHLGQFQDECFKSLTIEDQRDRGTRMNLQTVRFFAKAAKYGSKYVYQTIPRLLTLWLDMGEDIRLSQTLIFDKLNKEVSRAIKVVPVYKWFTAFPQIVSRIGHTNNAVYQILSNLISMVIQEYPKQALWLFVSVVKSTKSQRWQRGKAILDKLRARNNLSKLISTSLQMFEELLRLCEHPVRDSQKVLNMAKDFPLLYRLAPSPLIIPLQEALTASLPPTASADAAYQPFPLNAPTIARFQEDIDVMPSMARPRKITIHGSNGHIYIFLGKPKDDLRKDARLMEFNSIINKLLKSNLDSRRRQLHIRTYGVVTLNEECGFIQWVPNTIPIRNALTKSYGARGIRAWSGDMDAVFQQIKHVDRVPSNDKKDKAPKVSDIPQKEKDEQVSRLFTSEILPLCVPKLSAQSDNIHIMRSLRFPPVFHEWFLETFPEPSTWLASRLAYGRTAAVMSMVGFILGLGDRHCENILLDINNGDVVHVDFNCIFEKGHSLATPERVPFRLTQNTVDGLGITGVEGVYRIACEVTYQLLRDNRDCLMSVLDAFVHDPLVEWEGVKWKMDRMAAETSNAAAADKNWDGVNPVSASANLRMVAKNALKPIEKKLKGIHGTSLERPEREISTSSLVEILIQQATNPANLARMYPGWAPWH